MRAVLSALLALLMSPGLSAAVAEECLRALRGALNGRAEWTMERRIGKDGPHLVSLGTVECTAGSGIVWRVTAPFETTVSMTPDAMIFADEDGIRRKPLSELPHYGELRRLTDRFAAGDAHAFDSLFELATEPLADGGWRLEMKPKISAMERLFGGIVLTGNALPTNAVLKTADGGGCTIRFRRSDDVR